MARQALPVADWEKHRLSDNEHQHDDDSYSDNDLNLESQDTSSHIPNEDASKSLLAPTNTKPHSPKRRRECITIRPALILTILLSALLGALSTLAVTSLLTHHKPTAHRNDNTLASPSHDDFTTTTFLETAPCGSTPAEARAAGCIFDLVSFNWLPPRCHDAALAAAFEAELEAAGMLSWYEDAGRARPLGRAQVATGEHTGVYVSLGYHLRHCTAMWRRMHRAIMEGGGGLGRVDSYIWSYHHTRHCEEMLLTRYNESDLGEVFTTEVRIKYPDCGVVLEDASS